METADYSKISTVEDMVEDMIKFKNLCENQKMKLWEIVLLQFFKDLSNPKKEQEIGSFNWIERVINLMDLWLEMKMYR
jgi:hypothetical protein